MKPELQKGEFVFCTLPENKGYHILGSFQEKEGLTSGFREVL